MMERYKGPERRTRNDSPWPRCFGNDGRLTPIARLAMTVSCAVLGLFGTTAAWLGPEVLHSYQGLVNDVHKIEQFVASAEVRMHVIEHDEHNDAAWIADHEKRLTVLEYDVVLETDRKTPGRH